MPSTVNMLNMLEPIKLPIEIPCSFLITAMIDATSSGRLVPIEIKVIPIILSLT